MSAIFIILLLSPLVFGTPIFNFGTPFDDDWDEQWGPEIDDYISNIKEEDVEFDHDYWRNFISSVFGDLYNWLHPEPKKYIDENGLNIVLDASCYKPEEIEVKTFSDHVTVKGKHESNENKHSSSDKKESFEHRFYVPFNVDLESIKVTRSSDGTLVIKAPFIHGKKIPVVEAGKPKNEEKNEEQDVTVVAITEIPEEN